MDYDKIHERNNEIWRRVHDLVDEMTLDLSQEEDEEVRQQLTEQFRFWRR